LCGGVCGSGEGELGFVVVVAEGDEDETEGEDLRGVEKVVLVFCFK